MTQWTKTVHPQVGGDTNGPQPPLIHPRVMSHPPRRTFPTVSVVEELGDVEGAAGGPGRRPVEAQQHRRHQVAAPQGPEQPLAGLGVVVRHAQHVS